MHGEEFLAEAIGESTEDILIGALTEDGKGLNGKPAASMRQQSLMIVKRSGMERFISGLLQADWSDGDISPENTMEKQLQPLGTVQPPYGRSRPIDFNQSHFYAQHFSQDELAAFVEFAGLSELYDKVVSKPFYTLL